MATESPMKIFWRARIALNLNKLLQDAWKPVKLKIVPFWILSPQVNPKSSKIVPSQYTVSHEGQVAILYFCPLNEKVKKLIRFYSKSVPSKVMMKNSIIVPSKFRNLNINLNFTVSFLLDVFIFNFLITNFQVRFKKFYP